jgi:hypothetical protein
MFREHLGIVLAVVGLVVVLLLVYAILKLFDRKRGTKFPLEETPALDTAEAGDDSTLIT